MNNVYKVTCSLNEDCVIVYVVCSDFHRITETVWKSQPTYVLHKVELLGTALQ